MGTCIHLNLRNSSSTWDFYIQRESLEKGSRSTTQGNMHISPRSRSKDPMWPTLCWFSTLIRLIICLCELCRYTVPTLGALGERGLRALGPALGADQYHFWGNTSPVPCEHCFTHVWLIPWRTNFVGEVSCYLQWTGEGPRYHTWKWQGNHSGGFRVMPKQNQQCLHTQDWTITLMRSIH